MPLYDFVRWMELAKDPTRIFALEEATLVVHIARETSPQDVVPLCDSAPRRALRFWAGRATPPDHIAPSGPYTHCAACLDVSRVLP